ncbi:hypothetical protein PVAND_007799 [Polypedilum vanderplanki]|uniref:Uncharacterized protein n=1 Tax=Polypedilum vanderplanki TaxID=319348 RepID=A0A9J6C7Q3_POLVA|nr:hypothetical protein PVAND_007799 [Polypedilum vanderplanki]
MKKNLKKFYDTNYADYEKVQVNLTEKISWENKTQIESDSKRIGPGEQGKPFVLTDPTEIAENKKYIEKEGFSILASDKISLNRALPDMRPQK